MFTLYNALIYISTQTTLYYLIKTIDNGDDRYMVKLNALALLEERGKTKYWLYKQLGMSYQNFCRMINNETKSIQYEMIDAMCAIFECTPNELLVMTYDEEE